MKSPGDTLAAAWHSVVEDPPVNVKARQLLAALGTTIAEMADGALNGAAKRADTDPLGVVADIGAAATAARELIGRELGDPEGQASRIEVLSAEALSKIELKPQTYLFQTQRAPLNSLGLAIGESRAGKGTLLLLMAMAVSAGASLGVGFAPIERRKTVFYTAEDVRDRIISRGQAVAKGFGLASLAEVEGFHAIIRPKPELLFDRPEDVDQFLRAVEPIGAGLIVIDNLRRLFHGDENDAGEVGPVMGALERVRDETGACVLVVHHEGKAPSSSKVLRSRGSSSIPGYADWQMEIRRPDCGLVSEVEAFGGRDTEDWSASFQKVTMPDGGIRFDLLQSPESAADAAFEEAVTKTEAALVELAVGSPGGVPQSILCERVGIHRNTLANYLKALQTRGRAAPIQGPRGTLKLWLPRSPGGSAV